MVGSPILTQMPQLSPKCQFGNHFWKPHGICKTHCIHMSLFLLVVESNEQEEKKISFISTLPQV